jgi:CheY-like chemotaxis protein
MDSHFSILIVEDDEDDRMCLLKAFDIIKKSQLVRFFISGYDLLKYIDTLTLQQQPALLVLDYNMPCINGKETLQKIRAHNMHHEVPAVIFSTASATHIKSDMEGLNVLACLQKGTCFSKLIEQVSFFSELVADDVDTLLGIA